MSKQKNLEKELLENDWEQKFFDDKSSYWFSKKFRFPVFDAIEVTYEPSSNCLLFEVKSGDEYAEVIINDITTYQDIVNTIQEQLKF